MCLTSLLGCLCWAQELDDRMEDLAVNAMGFLGQAWKGANRLAASAAEELKEGLKDVKELHLVKNLQSGAQHVAAKGVGALERLGDTALGTWLREREEEGGLHCGQPSREFTRDWFEL